MSDRLLPVPFHGDTLYLIDHVGDPHFAAKPACDALGLTWQRQAEKLQRNSKRWGVTKLVIPTAGGRQEMLCLPLRKLAAWLGSIEPRKVKAELRAKIEQYQDECDDALWAYWNQGRADNPHLTRPAAPPPVPQPETITLTKDAFIALQAEKIELLQAKLELAALKPPVKPKKPAPVPLTPEKRAWIVQLLGQGISKTEIGRRVGVSAGAVYMVQRELRAGGVA